MLCLHSCRDPEEVTAMNEEKMLDDYMEMLKKEFNLRMNKGAYYVKEEQLVAGNLIHNPYSYVLYSYNIPKYKSEFFYNRDVIHVEYPPTKFRFEGGDRLIWPLEFEALKDIPFFYKTTKSRLLLEIIDYYGLRPYLWSSLIYDKSKGNDFEKIEKIFDEYPNIKYDATNVQWECGLLDKRDPGYSVSFIYVQDKECVIKKKNYKDRVDEYSLKGIEKYGKIFNEYFSQERNLVEIDWYEFMKFNNITPILIFDIPDYLTKKDVEKLRDEITKHYNKKDFIILLQGTDTYIDKNGNEIHEAFGVW